MTFKRKTIELMDFPARDVTSMQASVVCHALYTAGEERKEKIPLTDDQKLVQMKWVYFILKMLLQVSDLIAHSLVLIQLWTPIVY